MEQYSGQWRSSAYEAVPYTKDYPECFLVLPELLDGAVAQGNATKVTIEIELHELTGVLKVIDNGKGITTTTNLLRLLNWASKKSLNTHHRYGHGSKKCLTKWNKDYHSKWHVRYRTSGKREDSFSSLFTYKGPFEGPEKEWEEDEDDTVSLMPSGLEWSIEFNREILQSICKPLEILNTIKEIIRSIYSRKYFDKTEFIIKISENDTIIKESSRENKWTTLQECVENEVINGNCMKIKSIVEDFNGVQLTYTKYHLTIEGRKQFSLKKDFPTYGNKNMNSTRIHISINGRTIEHLPYWECLGKSSAHNSLNGIIGFVNFEGTDVKDYEKMPTPSTTKVSFYENCDIYKAFLKRFSIIDNDTEPLPNPPVVYQNSSKKLSTGSDLEDFNDNEETEVSLKKELPKSSYHHFIYLIEQHDVNKNKTVYKFGKTTRNFINRLSEHGKTSKVLLVMEVEDCHSNEKTILRILKNDKEIVQERDLGKEFFSCEKKQYIKNLILQKVIDIHNEKTI
jgi:hypothetical protein